MPNMHRIYIRHVNLTEYEYQIYSYRRRKNIHIQILNIWLLIFEYSNNRIYLCYGRPCETEICLLKLVSEIFSVTRILTAICREGGVYEC